MGQDCDGGGNRYLSSVNFTTNAALQRLFKGREGVPAGVCSIQMTLDGPPWIVCPRRLLVLGRQADDSRVYQRKSEEHVLSLLEYKKGTRLGVWPEVKMKYTGTVNGLQKSFDYTFDYVVMPVGRASDEQIAEATGKTWSEMRTVMRRSGYQISEEGTHQYVEDGPIGIPHVIEIMTSSTSGGNKTKRTTIPMAFEDAVLGRPHAAPGINYRQVWARMVSQLIVKSEITLAWGGKTLWIVQDVLVDYITSSTALNIRDFLAKRTSEVNMLSFSYGKKVGAPDGVIELSDERLYSGPMGSGKREKPSFKDMIRAPICPPLSRLVLLLSRRTPSTILIAP